tara:strand:- start:2032 stop:3051 length:1020 start_codon:yes stop_codon:yes gene_type:complete
MIEQKLKIKNYKTNRNKVLIIAEIGINHLGNEKYCKKLITEAKKSGADCVKLQIVNPDESYEKGTQSYSLFKKCRLSLESLKRINDFCKKKNILLFATPGDQDSLNIVKKLMFPLIKISSGLNSNRYLLNEILKLKLPLIVSLGMSSEIESKKIYNYIKKKSNNFALLKCTSIYPALDKELNLNTISKFKKIFNCTIGYSDHSLDDLPVLTAVSNGASIIEKHFTTNKKLKVADHDISMEPNEFKLMVKKIRRIEKILGSTSKFLNQNETINKKKFQRILFSSVEIDKNEVLKIDKIFFKRPIKRKKYDITANKYKDYLGKKLIKKISKNKQIGSNFLN